MPMLRLVMAQRAVAKPLTVTRSIATPHLQSRSVGAGAAQCVCVCIILYFYPTTCGPGRPLGYMLGTPNYPQTKDATVEDGWRVGCAATRRETAQIGPSAKLAGLVPSVTGYYASSTIESTLLISISYEGMRWRVVHAEGRGTGYRRRTLLEI